MDRTALCNLALDHLGVDNPISDWQEGSREADACARHYQSSLEAALRSHHWAFATAYRWGAQVKDDDENRLPGFDFRYVYPANACKIRSIHLRALDEPGPPNKFVVALRADGKPGHIIHCNIQPCLIAFTAADVAESLFDPLFVKAFSYTLAAALAIPLTRDEKISTKMENLAKVWVPKAEVASSNEGVENTREKDPDWIQARGPTG